jgi:hypothetical protein
VSASLKSCKSTFASCRNTAPTAAGVVLSCLTKNDTLAATFKMLAAALNQAQLVTDTLNILTNGSAASPGLLRSQRQAVVVTIEETFVQTVTTYTVTLTSVGK